MTLVHACPACGAEESLDVLLLRMIDDDQVRRLIADVICHAVPVGGAVVRYLRLFKPPKQRLRMSKLSAVLSELVPDITRQAIKTKGRTWSTTDAVWLDAFAAVHAAVDSGKLTTPLGSNVYLYAVVQAKADRAEAETERQNEADRRDRRIYGSQPTVPVALAHVPVLSPPPPPSSPAKTPGPEVAEMLKATRQRLRAGRLGPAAANTEEPATTQTDEEKKP